jgi:hypothetical protein
MAQSLHAQIFWNFRERVEHEVPFWIYIPSTLRDTENLLFMHVYRIFNLPDKNPYSLLSLVVA